MALKLKNRSENPRKKVLIYGLDGTGKSTFAETYCKQNGLDPIVIDIDDTNFTGLDILDLRFANDMQTYTIVKNTIKEIGKTPEYDTIILDGVSSLLEMLTSKAKGRAAYSDRSKRWNDILFELENTHKNLIFIGQIDLEMLFNDDYQPSKAVIKVNSLVNEKYRCYIDDKGNYTYETKKFRTLEQIEAESKVTKKEKPKPSGFETAATIDPTDKNPVIENYVHTIAKRVALQGNKISKRTMRAKTFELVQMGDIPTELKDEIYLYINENCPGEK